jgi:predicted RNase H-like nuclease (RuvC/YqgF family)
MRICVKEFVLGFVLVCLAAASGYAQEKADTGNTSLGDIARKLKAQKGKEPKPTMVITNDNISVPKEGVSEVGSTPPPKTPPDTAAEKPVKAHDEAYFRSQLSKLQDQLDTDKRELNVLQQKLGQNQTQYYPDPNKTLQQEYTRGDIDKLTAQIDSKKQQIANDEKAIDDLRDQLRHEGGDPGWLR